MRYKKSLYMFIILLIICMTWMIMVIKGHMPYIDQSTRGFVIFIAETNIYRVMLLITELGSQLFLIPFTIVAGLLLIWMYRSLLPAVFYTGGTLLSHVLNTLIKALVARERPRIFIEANAEGYSFPSGHAMISMVSYGLLIYFLVKRLSSMKVIMTIKISFSLLILLIGMSRFLINVHYPTDILTGFLIGYIILFGLIHLFEWIERKQVKGDYNV